MIWHQGIVVKNEFISHIVSFKAYNINIIILIIFKNHVFIISLWQGYDKKSQEIQSKSFEPSPIIYDVFN